MRKVKQAGRRRAKERPAQQCELQERGILPKPEQNRECQRQSRGLGSLIALLIADRLNNPCHEPRISSRQDRSIRGGLVVLRLPSRLGFPSKMLPTHLARTAVDFRTSCRRQRHARQIWQSISHWAFRANMEDLVRMQNKYDIAPAHEPEAHIRIMLYIPKGALPCCAQRKLFWNL